MRQALELALEALENPNSGLVPHKGEWNSRQSIAITAIKEALAQTQEPVAVVNVHEFYDNCANFSLLQKLPKGKHTLYTAPPQRTWVGLNKEEAFELQVKHKDKPFSLSAAVENLLREKNQ